VARQPIFDGQMVVLAYELLYRASAHDSHARFADGATATAQVVVGSMAEIGLERLSGGSDVHLNLPRELIVDPVELPLRAESTVLEVLESVGSDAAVLTGIRVFRDQGYRIALDDFVSAGHDEGLLQLADIVKIDLLREPVDRWADTAAMLLDRGLQVIAEKVETREQFEQCRALGIQGFQGYWFQRPETFVAQRATSNRLATLQVLSALQDPDCPMVVLERVVQQDLGLVYRLLRVINSGYYNLPLAVTSVRDAILMLGQDNLRRLCTIMALAAFNDRPHELLVNTLIRARMCELLSSITHPNHSGELFLAGLLSHIDALLGVSTAEAIQSLPLAKDLEMALISHAGPIGATLKSVVTFERGDWSASSAGGVDLAQLQIAYFDAIGWADQARTLLRV
jgi:c-di-GMP phosphodiesterase